MSYTKIIVIVVLVILGTVVALAMTDDGNGLIDAAYGEMFFNRGVK